MYQSIRAPGAEPTPWRRSRSTYIPLMDERGRHITDFVIGSGYGSMGDAGADCEAGVGEAGESDKGITLYRRLLQEAAGGR